MKVKDLISYLLDFNMNAEVVLSTGDTYDDIEDLDISYGGPNSADGMTPFDAEYIYINTHYNNEQLIEPPKESWDEFIDQCLNT